MLSLNKLLPFLTQTEACEYMGISITHFKYHLSRQPIKGLFMVVKLGGGGGR